MSNSTSSQTLLASISTTILSSESSSTTKEATTTSIVTPSLSALESSSSISITNESSNQTSSIASSSDSSLRSFHSHSHSSSYTPSSFIITASESSYFSSSSSSSYLPELTSSSSESLSLPTILIHSHSSSSTKDTASSSIIHSSTSSESSSSHLSSQSGSPSSSSSSYAPETTTSEDDTSTTLVYTQIYCLTDSSTTLTTALPVSTVLDDSSTFSYSTGSIVTTDLAMFANSLSGLRNSKSNSPESSSKGTIAGSVVGSVAGVSILLFLLWWFVFRKRSFDKNNSNSEKGSFTHSINSTRRLHDDEYDFDNGHYREYNEKPHDESLNSGSLGSFFHKFSKASPEPNYEIPTLSPQQHLDGLGSLRSSILSGQQIPNERTPITSSMNNTSITPTRPQRSQLPDTNLRTIDTVYEETESETSTLARSHRLSSTPRGARAQRYQNVGLRIQNPFDESSGSPTKASYKKAPPPPPTRKVNSYNVVDSNNVSVSRLSVESNTSSVISDETESSGTDESFGSIQMDVDPNNRHVNNGGFFKEIV